jgi:Protein of unknown function (DUF2934)
MGVLPYAVLGVKVSTSKVRVIPRLDPFRQEETFEKDPVRRFSQDEIRTRAYQIYEFRNLNGKHADEDWSQAETELMELLHAK